MNDAAARRRYGKSPLRSPVPSQFRWFHASIRGTSGGVDHDVPLGSIVPCGQVAALAVVLICIGFLIICAPWNIENGAGRVWIAYALWALSFVSIAWNPSQAAPHGRGLIVILLLPIIDSLDYSRPPLACDVIYYAWPLDAQIVSLYWLMLRGAWVWGLLGAAVSLVSTTASVMRVGGDATLIPEILLHGVRIWVGLLMWFLMRKFMQRVAEANRITAASLATSASKDAARREREQRTNELLAISRPMMERIATGVQLSREEQRECMLVEAAVRDAIRAPTLSVGSVPQAARNARSRGVQVQLLDDGGLGDSAINQEVILAVVTTVIENAQQGTITVRILPPGRSDILTIVCDDPRSVTRVRLDQQGRVHRDFG